MTHSISPENVIQHMEVPGERGLFVVGCFEKRVTLLSQQVRALNIVFALHQNKRLKAGSKVAVIGGGVAGMTAAAAAARLGCDVTLLEKKNALLYILRGNTTRLIHPHVYDWPLEGAEREDAALPLLSWKAGLASGVVKQLENAWAALPERSKIAAIFNVESIHIEMEGNRAGQRLITWNISSSTTSSHEEDSFDVVLLTVGFGLERKVDGIQWSSYWDNDRLNQPVRGSSSERYLISGCGDGGLVDLLRIRLDEFRHERVLKEFLSASSLGPLKTRLLEIEEQARQLDDEAASSAHIVKQYKELPYLDELDEKIGSRLRGDTTAVLNGLGTRPLTLQSSILNRLLVSRLLFRFGVHYRPGRFKSQKQGEQYEVRFDTGKPEIFNHIICRHGPHPSALEEEFQSIWSKCELVRARNVLDQTRWPLWPRGFFGPEDEPNERRPSSSSQPVHSPNPGGESHGGSAGAVAVQQPGRPEPVSQRAVVSLEPRSEPSRDKAVDTRRERPDSDVLLKGSSKTHVTLRFQDALTATPAKPEPVSRRAAVSSDSRSEPSNNKAEGTKRERSGPEPLMTGSPAVDAVGASLPRERSASPGASQPAQEPVVATEQRPAGQDSKDSPAAPKSGGKSMSAGAVLLIGAAVGFLLLKDRQQVAASDTNESDRRRTGVVNTPPPSSKSPGGASSEGNSSAKLRQLHRVRSLQSGEQSQTLAALPPGVFAFVDPAAQFLSLQAPTARVQSSDNVEVHRLSDGRFHLVGYVWDVESRALGTGRSTPVFLFPRPYGRSQVLVSIPFDRIRSAHVKSEQGQRSLSLEVGGSTEM
ncbi:MAG TPA: FAD-dependent oxidoreductase [Archangium sp.]|uniref:FAD-dependent oxidoreductase n=1 Tax=Archangium sp. TaxID=1872627 RepID=UPI002E34D8FA|nr:FAD-dependent oxidoreductase [Archangium sp.]HEX5753185.1 FAD-dependent oxidoreductase [Archangium sp.]